VKKHICIVVASEMTVTTFLLEHLMALSGCYQVSLVVNTTTPDFLAAQGLNVRVISVAIERQIRPWPDITRTIHKCFFALACL